MVSSTKLLSTLLEGYFGVRSCYSSLRIYFKSVGVFNDLSASGLVKACFYGVFVLLFMESILCLC